MRVEEVTMKNWFRAFLFTGNDQDPSFITLVRIVLGIAAISGLGMAIGLSLFTVAKINWLTVSIVFSIDFLTILFFGLTYRQILWPGKLFLPIAMLVAVPYIAATQANGLHDSSITLFPVIIVVAGLLLGQKIIPLVTILSFLGTWFVAYYDMAGLNDSIIAPRTGYDDVIVITLGQVITAGALTGLMTRLNRALTQSRTTEQAQIQANQELRALQITLEERIEERTAELQNRTRELEQLSESLERRATQFQAIAEVSKAISELGGQMVDVLPRIANIVSQQFNFYHVGVFLLDEHGEYAILQAANSEGGMRMLARQHKLKVGSEGIVGFVTHWGTPRIALDTGADAVFFDNPDLPETHSEMALPLRTSERIIGALDIQSTQPNAFSSNDIEALNVLAGQVRIAIENARLYDEAQHSLAESERIYRQYIQREYAQLARSRKERGFIYDQVALRQRQTINEQ
jgi:GAF domain-containing protein